MGLLSVWFMSMGLLSYIQLKHYLTQSTVVACPCVRTVSNIHNIIWANAIWQQMSREQQVFVNYIKQSGAQVSVCRQIKDTVTLNQGIYSCILKIHKPRLPQWNSSTCYPRWTWNEKPWRQLFESKSRQYTWNISCKIPALLLLVSGTQLTTIMHRQIRGNQRRIMCIRLN